ncbi:MAG: acyloxyacyl hydrolase [Chlorobiaceae bacterium]|nr:acyloxyacyl hydrolase [Chlorobiaceae bacterium]
MNLYFRRVISPLMLIASLLILSQPLKANASDGLPETEKKPAVVLNELGFGSGYVWGSLNRKADNITVYPLFARVGFNMNRVVGIEGSKSTLQLALEPHVNVISGPQDGVEAGCGIGLRYFRKLASPVELFFEASFAPMFLSIDSVEQGKGGFNFLDQFGSGVQYRISPKTALFGGYRWRHISHAGLVDRSNMGINSNAIIAGVSWLY